MICHFHAKVIARRRKAWFPLRMSRILFAAKTQLNDIAHKQTIICGQLFVGHVVGSPPVERRKSFYRMIILDVSFCAIKLNE